MITCGFGEVEETVLLCRGQTASASDCMFLSISSSQKSDGATPPPSVDGGPPHPAFLSLVLFEFPPFTLGYLLQCCAGRDTRGGVKGDRMTVDTETEKEVSECETTGRRQDTAHVAIVT